MVEIEEFVCKGVDWLGEETEGAGIILEGGVVVRLAKHVLMDGGGGRPGLDLKGGGRSGRSFLLAGLERKIHFFVQFRPITICQKEETVNWSTLEEEEGLRSWTRWWDLVCSVCQRFSSGVETEASDEQQGWGAWVAADFGLLTLCWVWGSDLELEAERECQKLLISNEKTTNQEKMAGN